MNEKILVDDEAGAAAYGVSKRTFLELQKEPFFPKPVMLGPRLKRHVLSELAAAVERMPRATFRDEPAQLRRARIEQLKAGA